MASFIDAATVAGSGVSALLVDGFICVSFTVGSTGGCARALPTDCQPPAAGCQRPKHRCPHRCGARRCAPPPSGSTRQVLDRSQTQRSRQARGILFAALADSPPTAALLGLAELADARGDAASANGLRARGLALT
jgi:hypothetical protein